jgi:HAD superfamily hydrolase (TIGR01509 family)
MIKAVLFDLGGVYFEDGTKKFLKILSTKTGTPVEKLYPIFREGKSLKYRENKISGREFFEWAAKQLSNKFAPDELNNIWVSEYTEISGIRDIIISLKNKGIIVTILSDNVPERITYLQEKYHFLDLFDDVILSYEVNLTKASSEIFELALSRINIKPEESIFVDDREVNLKVAKKLKLNTILFTGVNNLKKDLKKMIDL